MIIMYPDDVVRFDHRKKMLCKQAIDAKISSHILASVIDQVESIMAERPEHAVRKTCIIFVNVFLVEIEQRVAYRPHILDRQFLRLAGRERFSGPAKPYATAFAKRCLQRDRQTA